MGRKTDRDEALHLTCLSLTAAAFLVSLPATAGAGAKESHTRPRAVVELFTSQGCTSCPPADEMLREMAERDDVVALAYHVTYWDYLGWRDTLATVDNTARQQDYSRAFGERSVYTPQAIINGRQQMNGAKRNHIEASISQLDNAQGGLSVPVRLSYDDGALTIQTEAYPHPVDQVQIVLVYFNPTTRVEIMRGRDNGRQFTYVNSVSRFHTVGMWSGERTRLEIPLSEITRKGAGGCAVLLQEMREGGLPGAILGAGILEPPR